jgi:CRISPR system Cascade subunit CasC
MNGRVGDAKKALEALVEVMATVTPSGGHARFGSHARADWILAERTNEHPRSLAVAFLEPVSHGHYVKEAASRLRETRGAQAKVYGGAQGAEYVLDALEGVGTLSELKTFASGGLE